METSKSFRAEKPVAYNDVLDYMSNELAEIAGRNPRTRVFVSADGYLDTRCRQDQARTVAEGFARYGKIHLLLAFTRLFVTPEENLRCMFAHKHVCARMIKKQKLMCHYLAIEVDALTKMLHLGRLGRNWDWHASPFERFVLYLKKSLREYPVRVAYLIRDSKLEGVMNPRGLQLEPVPDPYDVYEDGDLLRLLKESYES